ncbi:MAG: hypothetical protein WC894_01075 [Patescibacteria group bacterium]
MVASEKPAVVHESSPKYSVKTLSPKALFDAMTCYLKGVMPEGSEAKFALEKYTLDWKTRAELENKKISTATKIVLGNQVSPEDIAREDLKRVYKQAAVGDIKDVPPEEELLKAVDKFRPKEPQLIRDEYALAPTEEEVLEALDKHSWERAANYLDAVDQRLKKSQAFTELKWRVSVVAQENLQFIAENFATKLQRGFKTDDLTYLAKYLDLGISRQDLFEKSGALGIVSNKIAGVLEGGPIKDEYTGINEYEKMGFSREQLLQESGALKIAATRIAEEFGTGYSTRVKESLSEYESIGLSRKQLLEASKAFDTAVGYLKEAFETYIEDKHTNLKDYVDLGLDRKALLQASGAVDFAAQKIAESLRVGRIAEVFKYFEEYNVIGLSDKALTAAVHRIDKKLKIPIKKV